MVGVLLRSVPEGLANLGPCPAVRTAAGEDILTPVANSADVLVGPTPAVDGIL